MPEITLQLSNETLEACQERTDGLEFDDVEEYISFILSEVVEKGPTSCPDPDTDIDREQLESLGYL